LDSFGEEESVGYGTDDQTFPRILSVQKVSTLIYAFFEIGHFASSRELDLQTQTIEKRRRSLKNATCNGQNGCNAGAKALVKKIVDECIEHFSKEYRMFSCILNHKTLKKCSRKTPEMVILD
jgi:hypothetical protein